MNEAGMTLNHATEQGPPRTPQRALGIKKVRRFVHVRPHNRNEQDIHTHTVVQALHVLTVAVNEYRAGATCIWQGRDAAWQHMRS